MNDGGDHDARKKKRERKKNNKKYWSGLDPKKRAQFNKKRVVSARKMREKAFEVALNEAKNKPPPPPPELPPSCKNAQAQGGYKTMSISDFLQQFDKRKIKKGEDIGHCECENQCGDDCYNKNVAVECTTHNCNVGEGCGNRWLTESQFLTSCAPREERHGRGKLGKGLKTFERIPEGSIIGPYLGELLEKTDLENLTTNDYLSIMGHGQWIDASKKGNLTRFINHSHKPNCEARKRSINGFDIKWIIATRAIAAEEFLSMSYNVKLPGECKNSCCRKNRKRKK